MIVMSEDRASLRLLTASNMIAIDPDNTPTTALKAARRTFAAIPMMLVRMITLFLFI